MTGRLSLLLAAVSVASLFGKGDAECAHAYKGILDGRAHLLGPYIIQPDVHHINFKFPLLVGCWRVALYVVSCSPTGAVHVNFIDSNTVHIHRQNAKQNGTVYALIQCKTHRSSTKPFLYKDLKWPKIYELSNDEDKTKHEEHTSPDDKKKSSGDKFEFPGNNEKITDDKHNSSDKKEKTTDEKEKSPNYKEKTADDKKKTLDDKEKSPDGKENSPANKEKTQNDEKQTPNHGILANAQESLIVLGKPTH